MFVDKRVAMLGFIESRTANFLWWAVLEADGLSISGESRTWMG